MLPSIKNSIIFGGIAIVLVLIYLFVFKKDPNDGVLIQNTVVPNVVGDVSTSLDKDFLPLLLNVKNIKLDNSIFSDPAFNSLVDSSIVLIPDGDEGRPNPFAPLNSVLNQSAKKITTESN